ncbi:MAG TPA: hypothetical protein VI197_32715, partial [Polyangiaceae bacterium]
IRHGLILGGSQATSLYHDGRERHQPGRLPAFRRSSCIRAQGRGAQCLRERAADRGGPACAVIDRKLSAPSNAFHGAGFVGR